MPKVSERGTLMPASPIRRLAPLAAEAKARGINVFHLNIGQPDLPTPPEALEALKHIDRKVLEYSPSDGLPSLRAKLKEYYHRFNIEVDVDDIIVTSGGSEASTPATRLSCPSRPMPTIWPSPSRPVPRSSPCRRA